MFTVVIPTHNAEMVLTHTLAALVSAAADGVVREVVIADSHSTDATAEIADATGCMWVEASAPGGAACRQAVQLARRGRWLLFLEAGVILETGWHHEALAFAEKAERHGRSPRAAVFRHAVDDIGLWPRLAETLAQLECAVTGIPQDGQGLLISRSHYEALGGHRALGWLSHADLMARLGRRARHTLRAEAYLPKELSDTSTASTFWSRLALALGLPVAPAR